MYCCFVCTFAISVALVGKVVRLFFPIVFCTKGLVAMRASTATIVSVFYVVYVDEFIFPVVSVC